MTPVSYSRTEEMLTAIIDKTPARTAYAAAKMIGVKPVTFYSWRDGKSTPDVYAMLRIAQILDIPVEQVAAVVELERATTSADRRSFWEAVLKSCAGVAASVLLCVTLTYHHPAQAANKVGYFNTGSSQFVLCQMGKALARVVSWLAGVVRNGLSAIARPMLI